MKLLHSTLLHPALLCRIPNHSRLRIDLTIEMISVDQIGESLYGTAYTLYVCVHYRHIYNICRYFDSETDTLNTTIPYGEQPYEDQSDNRLSDNEGENRTSPSDTAATSQVCTCTMCICLYVCYGLYVNSTNNSSKSRSGVFLCTPLPSRKSSIPTNY